MENWSGECFHSLNDTVLETFNLQMYFQYLALWSQVVTASILRPACGYCTRHARCTPERHVGAQQSDLLRAFDVASNILYYSHASCASLLIFYEASV